MYRMSPKQIILLSLLSALFAGAMVAAYDRYWQIAEPVVGADRGFTTETAPAPLSPDDLNNMQVYESVSPGVVNITSTSYTEDFWGLDVYPQQGTGSGSIIDQKGNILTNYHVVKDAKELKVTLADKSTYDGK